MAEVPSSDVDVRQDGDDGNSGSDDGDGDPDGAQPSGHVLRSTRRTDCVLALARFATGVLQRQLDGGDTRLVHARRKRGDG